MNKHIWMPFWVTGAASLLLCAVTRVPPIALGQLVLTTLATAVLPLWGRVSHRPFPPAVNWLVAGHLLLASHGGSVLGFYARIPWWDLLMHTLFGLVAAVVLLALLRRLGGGGLHPFGVALFLFLAVMGVGALWELSEFAADALFGGDALRVQAALVAGIHPLRDTVTDLLVTTIGPLLVGIWQMKKPLDE
ncbi:MAG: hypothetical protein J6R77_05815 [Clostridia bacterium]|nr:hypothetical protein [Clostridia bacterium]